MARIKKEVDLTGGFKLTLMIDDGIAVMGCNYAKALLNIYFEAKKKGQAVSYDFRRNIMTEKFPGVKAERIEEMLDHDITIAHKKQKEAIDAKKVELKEDK
jgi:hypothetical protein